MSSAIVMTEAESQLRRFACSVNARAAAASGVIDGVSGFFTALHFSCGIPLSWISESIPV